MMMVGQASLQSLSLSYVPIFFGKICKTNLLLFPFQPIFILLFSLIKTRKKMVLSLVPCHYSTLDIYNNVVMYFGQNGICQFERSHKPGQVQLHAENA